MAETKSINTKLSKIQKDLKAPKGQYNQFGKYNYRSCEDILEAVKPHLNGLTLIINDEIVPLGDRVYVKATATLSDGKDSISADAYAREADKKTGMDSAQLTGATSSYARKYALNGLFAIDDNQDADTQDNREEGKPPVKKKETTKEARTVEKANGDPVLLCGCGREISARVRDYSERNYGKPLCMICQTKEKKNEAKMETNS